MGDKTVVRYKIIKHNSHYEFSRDTQHAYGTYNKRIILNHIDIEMTKLLLKLIDEHEI